MITIAIIIILLKFNYNITEVKRTFRLVNDQIQFAHGEMVMTKTPDAVRRKKKGFSTQTLVKTDHSTQESAEISLQLDEKKKKNFSVFFTRTIGKAIRKPK